MGYFKDDYYYFDKENFNVTTGEEYTNYNNQDVLEITTITYKVFKHILQANLYEMLKCNTSYATAGYKWELLDNEDTLIDYTQELEYELFNYCKKCGDLIPIYKENTEIY